MSIANRKPWYSEGLRFSCLKCGRCCTGDPGFVWLEKPDIETMAKALQIGTSEFFKKYCRYVSGRISLLERENGDCIFFSPSGCSVYPARPRQCRIFPFWPHLLASKRAWEKEKKRCPGIGQGKLYSRHDIEDIGG